MSNRPTVIVIGDIILDEYVEIDSAGMSAETPIPIYKELDRYISLGGAANVAVNVKEFGLETILIGVVGVSLHQVLEDKLKERDIAFCIFEENRKTTKKTRYIHYGKQIFRVDDEDDYGISEGTTDKIMASLKRFLLDKTIAAIILQDYDKGMFEEQPLQKIIEIASAYKVPIFADPKRKNFHSYKNIYFFKPNKREFFEGLSLASNISEEAWIAAAKEFAKSQNIEYLAITRSDKGIACIHNNEVLIIPGYELADADVSGAGDTVIAAAVYIFLQNLSVGECFAFMNKAGAAACRKRGVQPVSLFDIEQI